MSSLSLIVKPLSIVQGIAFKLSSALFTVGATDYTLSISVLGGSLYSNGSVVGASGSFSLADLKAGKITFLADGLSVPSFFFQAHASGFSDSTEVQPVLNYKAVNQAPVLSVPSLGSDAEILLKGGSLTITREMINATDAETPFAGNISFKIAKVTGGGFLLNGFAAKSFSLADIDASSVSFKHDGKLIAPAFTLTVSDSDGSASVAKSTSSSTVHFDGSHSAVAASTIPHEIAIKAPIALVEGATLKLSASNLPIVVSINVVPAANQGALVLRVEDSNHLTILVSGKSGPQESFTVAELKAGLVSIVHDGSQEAPSLNLSLLNGVTELDSLSVPFAFKTLNDAPTLSLNDLVFSQGPSLLLDRGLFNVADEETPDSLSGAFAFTIKSATGLEFHREGTQAPIKGFTLADVDNGLISVTRLVTQASDAAYSLSVADPAGKISGLANGTVVFNHLPTGTVSISGAGTTLREGQTLSANNSLADADGLGRISYTWKDQDGHVLGTGNTLTLTQAQVGGQVQVSASYVDGFGTAEAVNSAFSGTIQEAIVSPSGTLSVIGDAVLGNTLHARVSNLSDPAGLGTLLYTWKDQVGTLLGTGKNLYLGEDMAARQITASVSYVNGQGKMGSLSATSFTTSDSTMSSDEAKVLPLAESDRVSECVLADGTRILITSSPGAKQQGWLQVSLPNPDAFKAAVALPDGGFVLASRVSGKLQLQTYFEDGLVQGKPQLLSLAITDSQQIQLHHQANGDLIIDLWSSDSHGDYLSQSRLSDGKLSAVEGRIWPLQDGWVKIVTTDSIHFQAQIYHSDGSLGGTANLASEGSNYEVLPFADSGFLVKWDGSDSLMAQAFDAEGTATSAVFKTLYGVTQAAVLNDHSLVVIDGSNGTEIKVAEFAPDGSPRTHEVLRSENSGSLEFRSLVALPDGSYAIDYMDQGSSSQFKSKVFTPLSQHQDVVIGSEYQAGVAVPDPTGWMTLKIGSAIDQWRDTVLTAQHVNAEGEFDLSFQVARSSESLTAGKAEGFTDGSLLVHWSEIFSDSRIEIHARIFSADGSALSNELTIAGAADAAFIPLAQGRFLVSSVTDATLKLYQSNGSSAAVTVSGSFSTPQITALADGGFILSGQSQSNAAIFQFQRYDSLGAVKGSKIQLVGDSGKIVNLSSGGYVVLTQMQDDEQMTHYELHRYNAAGQAVGSSVELLPTPYSPENPDVLADSQGGFVAVYSVNDHGIYAQHFSDSEAGQSFYVGGADNHQPIAIKLADGGFAAAWRESDSDLNAHYFAQRFEAGGQLRGEKISFDTHGELIAPHLNELEDGSLCLSGQSDSVLSLFHEVDGGDIVTWHGLYGADHINGSEAADHISQIGSGDEVQAGAGNDHFSLAGSDFVKIDGGEGIDTLVLSASLDLTSLADSKLKNLEVVDLGSGATLSLTAADVIAMTESAHALRVIGSGKVDLDSGWTVEDLGGLERYTKDGAMLLIQPEIQVI
ncbi:MAG: hypothetical protein RL095_280 [Verrucomicrobiota bacterium]